MSCWACVSPLRHVLLITLILSIISNLPVSSNNEEDWEVRLNENEKLALDAIKSLHRQLDDDKDGNINLHESNEYLREELKYERDYEKRHKAFHRNDDNQVTVRELWETWVKSEVHNWTNDQTIDWLKFFVGLPQYTTIFEDKLINGTFLPRLAVNHQQFLTSALGVNNVIHKQKISLKAQDVVLFGPPKEHTNYLKDAILTSLLVIALGICWNVSVRYKSSQRELTKIMKDMEGLAKAEKELQDLQNVMEKTKVEHEELSKQIEKSMSHKNFSELELPDDQVREEVSRLRSEVEVLRSELQRAEVELQDKCWVPPPALQHWLQLTYELELKTYNRKKQSAERQLRQAKDACEKLKKKRSSLIGAFASTHGKSIDDVDKAILEAKGSLTEITHELQERMNRWKQIEILTNCPIMNNPGLHYLETVLRGYGKAPSYAGPGSVISNSQDDIDDDASSIYCPSAVSAPPPTTSASHHQQPSMPRSRSVGNMQNYRHHGGRDQIVRESSTTDEDTAFAEASAEVLASARADKDRRVTFGNRPENRSEASTNGVEQTQNLKNGHAFVVAAEQPSSIVVPGHEEIKDDCESEAFNSPEKPDLIKVSSCPEVKVQERLDDAAVLNGLTSAKAQQGDLDESRNVQQVDCDVSPNAEQVDLDVSQTPATEEHSSTVTNGVSHVNGLAVPISLTLPQSDGSNASLSRKGRLSGKSSVLRSISRLVSQGAESLRAHKHYKVHAADNDKGAKRVEAESTENVNESIIRQNGTTDPVVNGIGTLPVAKKPKSKLFASFRTKKKGIETK